MGSEPATDNRVRLVPPTEADEASFLKSMHSSRGLHQPWVFPPLDSVAFTRFLTRGRQDDEDVFLLKTTATDELCGVVALNVIIYQALCSANLSYYGVSGFEQKGLMKEGLLLLIRHAFDHLDLHRLEANIQPANQSSIQLIQSIGFRREGFSPNYLKIAGHWCDHERWALLSSEFPC